MELSIRIAEAIKNTIKEKGITRLQLAQKVGVQPSVVTSWLSGKHNFTLLTLCKIQIALETQIIYIIKQ